MPISGFDHVAIPVADPDAMLRFYRALGFQGPAPDEWRAINPRAFAVQFGANKINMHAPDWWQSPEFSLRGPTAVPGCGDFCFVWDGAVAEVAALLAKAGAPVEVGPVTRVGGAKGGTARGTSLYTRDPDGNLLEFIVYGETPDAAGIAV